MNKAGTIILIIFLALLAVGIGVFAFFFSIGAIQLNGNYYNILTDIEDVNLNNNDTVIIEGYE